MDSTEVSSKEPTELVTNSAEAIKVDKASKYRLDPDVPFVRLTKAEKKAKKEAERKEHWKTKRPLERAAKKRKRAEMIQNIKESGGNPRAELVDGKENPVHRLKRRKLEELDFSDQKVVIDLGFDEEMNDKDIRSLGSQLTYLYGKNRTVEHPLQIHFTSFGGQVEQHLNTLNGFKNWIGMNYHTEGYIDVWKDQTDKLVYLSAESDTVLTDLKADDIYIIGGLVDHNRLKGICHDKATKQGIRTAQLHIGQFMDMKARKVLTVNQVYEILLQYTVKKDWAQAFEMIIPKRKGGSILDIPSKELDSSDAASPTGLDTPSSPPIEPVKMDQVLEEASETVPQQLSVPQEEKTE